MSSSATGVGPAVGTAVVRPGTLDDAPGVARLLNALITDGAPLLLTGPFSDEEERAFLEGIPARGGFLVAEARGPVAPLGIVAAQVLAPYAGDMPAHDHVAVMGTWVASAWRRRGLGRALCDQSFAQARSRGFTKVFTDVRADNIDSLAFHLAMGFKVAGTARAQAVIGGRAYDVVFIERFL